MTTFIPEMFAKVVVGDKLHTRRLWRDGDVLIDDKLMRLDKHGKLRIKFEVGKTYAVQPGRGKAGAGRMLVTAIRLDEDVRNISQQGARAEGFENIPQFIETWVKLNDSAIKTKWRTYHCRPAQFYKAWVIEFRYLPTTSTSESVTAL